MAIHLGQLYISIVEKIDTQRNLISEEDFESNSPKPALYILFLHSALENYIAISFKEVIKKSVLADDVRAYFLGKCGNFSLKSDYPLFCCYFLPNIYDKSEIRTMIIEKRNGFAHRIIDKNGKYLFESDAKYELSPEQLNQFIKYSKELMQTIRNAVENIEN